MSTFTISDQFYMDGKPFKILSGSIHYFRIPKESWYHSLYNLKALGFNTVETYVPWNYHEAKEETYNFSDNHDLDFFLSQAQELGLYVLLRPSPYICAEWEFGGLPAWLLTKKVKVRSTDPNYLFYVNRYYDKLIPILKKHELANGGNIIMHQVENEYGSYGDEKAYLKALKTMMVEKGLQAPLFTSDGSWQAALSAGSLIDEDVLVTGNFGSRPQENFAALSLFLEDHGKKWPLMCMEFWDGWFNRYKEPIIKRDPQETVDTIMETIALGNINLYMFHGGSNFAFMNGCSARGKIDLPQVTSYDYDAILDEAGNPTKKYRLLQKSIQELFPNHDYHEPLVKETMEIKDIPLVNKVSLVSTLDKLSDVTKTYYPLNMEDLGQSTGYIFYRTKINKESAEVEKISLIDARDRVQIFQNNQWLATQYQEEVGQEVLINLEEENNLDLLIENMGRINYGPRLTAPSQSKGLGSGLIADLHFVGNWGIYPLPMDDISAIDYTNQWLPNTPAFYEFQFDCQDCQDTYIDMTGFGKGLVFINGKNLGRFWEVGPIVSLYLPKSYLITGNNKLTVFETEGKYRNKINLVKHPIIIDVKGENL